MHRVLDLDDHSPADGRVICVDEFGPLNLLPRKGKAWRLQARPQRLRATYNRNDGVMHMLAALDLATGHISYRIRSRKRRQEFLAFLKICGHAGPARRCTSSATTSPHTTTPTSAPGAPTTKSSWCSCPPTRRG